MRRAGLRPPCAVPARCGFWRRSSAAPPPPATSAPAQIRWRWRARTCREGRPRSAVLTDREYFGGDLDFLRAVRRAVAVPVIRKDFLIHPVQVWEARAAGADAVLLIVRILEQPLLQELHGLARELGMDALVEAHTEAELDRALDAGATLVGVNNRDLDTFVTDLDLCVRLAAARAAAA